MAYIKDELRAKGSLMVASKLRNALSMTETYKYHSHVIKGNEGEFWVVTPGAAWKLEQMGYEVVGLRGHRVVNVAELGQPIN